MAQTRSAVLVDLDGTMIDPRRSIIGSVQHALQALGARVPAMPDLDWVIGPPLRESFPKLLAGANKDLIERAVALYRAHYTGGAMFDATVYEGIPAALAALQGNGLELIVATSKPHAYARPILEHFGLSRYFTAIHGAELDGRNDDKSDLIAHIIATENLDPARTVMVGDRRFDVAGAAQNAVPCIGVTWGFGSRDELQASGAVALCANPAQLDQIIGRVLPAGR